MQEFSFPSYYDMTIVGNFVVGRANAHELHLSWHQLAVPGGAVLHTKEIPLKKVWRVHVVLMYLEMNHEGMLLLRLRETGKDRARSAVYSPIDGKTVWRQDHRHKDPRYGVPGELTPLLIGRSVLHCARRGSNRDTFDLVGIDFRASNPTVIYETSVVGRRHWAHNKFCRRLVLIGEQHELVVLSDNEQWVGTGTISILSGENGQLLFQFDGGPAHFLGHKTVAYPTINQFSIQTVPARIRLNDAVQPWEAHAKVVKDFIIIETFLITFSGSDNSTISILRLGTDVVLSPCSIHKIAIQPFAKVAVALQSDDNTILSDRILSHPLVETNKTHLIQMAEAVLQASCPQHSDPPSLRHCFILQEPGIKINLRPSFSQPGPLAAAQDIRMRSLGGFVDGGRLLLEASETQVLLQF
ncbi:hypothetical protein KXX33_002595 [Aspergillus fumigatus]|nr:hypothetical protein CNMCM8686_008316 [Aspergillus fumigatus]KAH1270233.1 hypothetical protein KXX45_001966 [Aspergillus fumigatus]KAH1282504.1 hypothetical protein KXX30_002361 [Aspergillus fumigatus]KAH1283169.1 hypothetical protein KXX48_002447 [Aspergillus fumigatus]KAH1310208.1 hypothetical protein KXX66_009261 [Aspergillus fumigatus]